MSDKLVAKTRSGRVRRPRLTFTPSKTTKVSVDYNINRKKAIQKKVAAATRAYDLEIDDKHGTLVLTFSAAAYEIFKVELPTYLNQKSRYTVNHTPKFSDNQGVVVEDSYAIYKKNDPNLQYRVNLFHTTSRADVNGRLYSHFITVDLPCLQKRLETYTGLDVMNDKLKRWCRKYLYTLDNATRVDNDKAKSVSTVASCLPSNSINSSDSTAMRPNTSSRSDVSLRAVSDSRRTAVNTQSGSANITTGKNTLRNFSVPQSL